MVLLKNWHLKSQLSKAKSVQTNVFALLLTAMNIISCGRADHRHPSDNRALSISEGSSSPTNCTNCEGGLSKSDFEEVIWDVWGLFYKIVEKLGDTDLNIQRNWESNELQAEAEKMSGNWDIRLGGGFPRRPDMTKDAYTLIVCHELGHLMGGFPFAQSPWAEQKYAKEDQAGTPSRNPLWTSNEGQSDYFAAQICAKKMWSHQKAVNAKMRDNIPPSAKAKCDATFKELDEQNLCYRILLASKDLIDVFVNIWREDRPDLYSEVPKPGLFSSVSFDRIDDSQIEKTLMDYPSFQCRLDTLIAGALCQVSWDESIIPGHHDNITRNNREAELQSATQACSEYGGQKQGSRPRCWFKPSL